MKNLKTELYDFDNKSNFKNYVTTPVEDNFVIALKQLISGWIQDPKKSLELKNGNDGNSLQFFVREYVNNNWSEQPNAKSLVDIFNSYITETINNQADVKKIGSLSVDKTKNMLSFIPSNTTQQTTTKPSETEKKSSSENSSQEQLTSSSDDNPAHAWENRAKEAIKSNVYGNVDPNTLKKFSPTTVKESLNEEIKRMKKLMNL